MRLLTVFCALSALAADLPSDLKKARDSQDRAALDRLAASAAAEAQAKSGDFAAQLRLAQTEQSRAEVALEVKDKNGARSAAESGIRAGERAVALKPSSSEAHRLLGALCGQVIPANVLLGLRYGRCAQDEVTKAIELDPKSARAVLARAVGNHYLPANFGGGDELALKDIEKAQQLDPADADIWLWRGIVLRKLARNAEAREAFSKSLQLNPARVWAREQLEKTPPK